MKSILSATDFSATGNNALHYAAALAKDAGATLQLLHVCHLPVVTGETPVMTYDIGEIEKIARERLQKEADGIVKVFGITCKAEVTTGLLRDEIKDIIDRDKISLVVLGTRGTGDTAGAFGGAAHEVMHSCGCPVIAVPSGFAYRPVKKIVFASDLHKDEHPQYSVLRDIAAIHQAKLQLVSIVHKNETPSMEKAVAGIRLEHDFEDMQHEMVLVEGDDEIEGLTRFVEGEQADLMVVLPHRHNIFRRLFGGTHTQKILKHTHLPVLSLPEVKA